MDGGEDENDDDLGNQEIQEDFESQDHDNSENTIPSNILSAEQDKCPVDNCYNSSPDRNITPFCAVHCCHWSGYHWGCRTRAVPGYYYCNDHRCHHPGCLARAMPDTSVCSDHVCKQQYCNNYAPFGYDYCRDHKCPTKFCPHKCGYGAAYCYDHQCEHSWSSSLRCQGQTLPNHKFCKAHGCPAQGCQKGCNQPVDGWPGLTVLYCDIHLCGADDCHEPGTAAFQLCINHKCVRCDEIRLTGKALCMDCTCNTPGCQKEAMPNSLFCHAHELSILTCTAFECGESAAAGSRFCLRHKCELCKRWNARRALCIYCGCNAPNCQKRSLENCSACEDHLCPVTQCTKPIAFTGLVRERYCLEHACSKSGCDQRATYIYNPNYRLCNNHYQKNMSCDTEHEEEEDVSEDEDG